MKRCPDCFAEYGDEVGFCRNDGKALVIASGGRARLCPHCANSIEEDAVKCPYCKAEITPSLAPQWPERSESSDATEVRSAPLSLRSKAILIAGIAVFAMGVFLMGGYQRRGEIRLLEEASLRQVKDSSLRIQTVEEQLARARQDIEASKNEIAALTVKLQESRKELAAVQQRLLNASREATRPAAKRAQDAGPVARKTAPAPARRAAAPGVYEVIRQTAVREEPSTRARALATIGKGTKITGVSASGEWLEVRSRQGKPPGFILVDDAMFVGGAN